MTLPELLRRSGQAIREKGWAKFIRHATGTDRSQMGIEYREGAVCALGAIEQALWDAKLLSPYEHLETSPLGSAALAALDAHVQGTSTVPYKGTKIANWNNWKATSAEEVIATFLAAAACEEGKARTLQTGVSSFVERNV